MRVILTSLLGALFALTIASPASAAQVNLPAGTRVEVRLVNPISSGAATAGEHFTFQAAAPVTAANHVLIAKGASGTGRVVSATKAQGKSAGKLTLEFTSIHATDGSTVNLTENSSMKGNAEKGKASTATIAATIALGPLGLFAHNMVKGKDVTVTPGQTFPAWVKSTTAVTVH